MRITADLKSGKLVLPERVFEISNDVRTLRLGNRKSYEVVRSIPSDRPYDPHPFPRGSWKITGVDWQKDKGFSSSTYGPAKIRTNAWQPVTVWELDEDGDYLRETREQVKDTCYWLHYSDSRTTLGCIRLASFADVTELAYVCLEVLGKGETVELEVI
jgi:hypothetical protein